MLGLVLQAEDEARESATQLSGRLCISGPLVFGERYLAPIVSEYCARYPSVTLEYRASQYFPDLVRDGIDAAVCIYHEIGDSTSISYKLGPSVAVLCASPDYVRPRRTRSSRRPGSSQLSQFGKSVVRNPVRFDRWSDHGCRDASRAAGWRNAGSALAGRGERAGCRCAAGLCGDRFPSAGDVSFACFPGGGVSIVEFMP